MGQLRKPSISESGSAAAQCGKAPPYRLSSRSPGGYASVRRSLRNKKVNRKGGAFPHWAAAEPLMCSPSAKQGR